MTGKQSTKENKDCGGGELCMNQKALINGQEYTLLEILTSLDGGQPLILCEEGNGKRAVCSEPLWCSCSLKDAPMADKRVNNFIGSSSTWENLHMIPKEKLPQLHALKETDRNFLMNGLDGIISQTLQDKIWEMIWKRWCAYEDLCHSR